MPLHCTPSAYRDAAGIGVGENPQGQNGTVVDLSGCPEGGQKLCCGNGDSHHYRADLLHKAFRGYT